MIPLTAEGVQNPAGTVFGKIKLSKSFEMRNCRKFDLPDGVPTPKAKKKAQHCHFHEGE